MPVSIPDTPDIVDRSIQRIFLKDGSRKRRIATDGGFMSFRTIPTWLKEKYKKKK